jgi:hypothetical protein
LEDIYEASEMQLVRILQEDGFLKDMVGEDCPHCNAGCLGELQDVASRGPRYRCDAKACQKWVVPHHNHPVFTSAHGPQHVPLKQQASILFASLAGADGPTVRLLFKRNHKLSEGLIGRMVALRAKFTEEHEKTIKFGLGPKWKDVEADEVDIRKKQLDEDSDDSNSEPELDQQVKWEQWGGIVERGFPETLVLTRLDPKLTSIRAPGPGAMRKRDWEPLAEKHLKGREIILHSDGARAYTMKIQGVIRDNIIHQKKMVVVNGVRQWVRPKLGKTVVHRLPDGEKLAVKAGTQVIDRFWRHLREHLHGVSACVGS